MPVFNRVELLKSLRLVASVVPDRTPTPILQYVALRSLDGKASLSATDQVVYCTSVLECSDDFCDCLVPAAKLLGLLSASSSEEVTLTVTSNGTALVDGHGTYTMVSPNKDEFPARPVPAQLTFATDSIYIARAMPLVSTCVSEKTAGGSYYIEGFRFDALDGKVNLVGTDLSRLCVCELGDGELEPFTIQSKAMKVVSQMQGKISIGCSDGLATFVTDTLTLTSRTMIGKFPKYASLFKDAESYLAWGIDRRELIEVLRKANLFTAEESKGLDIAIDPSTTKICSTGADIGRCGVSIKGGSAKTGTIRFNGERLLGIVSKIPEQCVTRFRIGKRLYAQVGDFCQFIMSPMEKQ